MFRKGGSAEGGITSGLQQHLKEARSIGPAELMYRHSDMDQNVMAESLQNRKSIGDMKAAWRIKCINAQERPQQARLNVDLGDF
jgi:hypothetical protein